MKIYESFLPLEIYISNLRIFCLSHKIWKRLFMVTPCTKSCQSLYQILANLVPDPGNLVPDPATPPTKLCHTLYQTLAHLVPDPCTPCTRPCQTLYHTLSHLVQDPATPPTKLCHTLYQTLPVHREQGAGPMRVII